jgi:RNA polymerase sigma-70 factor, ECF subfamily
MSPGGLGAMVRAGAASASAAKAAGHDAGRFPLVTTNEDLAGLLARVALKDRAAFEQVYRATCAHLLGIAFRILSQRERAEEVLQESFISVWHNAGGFRASVASPMTWLINIVRNKAIDTLRSGKTERRMTFALDEEDALQVADDESREPQHLLDESLTRLKIDACMADLGAHERQALALAYYRGMVHTEIAEALNAPLGTAKAWVRRGLDKLRRCLESVGVQSA